MECYICVYICIHRHKYIYVCVYTNTHTNTHIHTYTHTLQVSIVKAKVFPVVMYRCESWTIKKAEHQRIDTFEQWCWRRLLRVPWTAKRSNQSVLKEINPKYSLEDRCWILSSSTLATWCKEPIHRKSPQCWVRLRAGGEGATEDEMVGWHHRLNGHEFEQTLGDSEGQGSLTRCIHRVVKSWTQLSNWRTTTNINVYTLTDKGTKIRKEGNTTAKPDCPEICFYSVV